MLRGLRTVGFQVKDLEAARDWYRELLGIAPYFDEPFYVGFDVGGYELGLQPAEGDAQPGVGGDVAYWGVDDVAVAIERAVELGATSLRPAQEVGGDIVVGAVRDPFGNVLGFIENRHFAPPLVAAASGDVADRAIVEEADLPLGADEAFALWSSSEGLAKWWTESSRIELRPGGHYELYFLLDEPYGRRGGEGCRVLSYLPGRMISFTWNAPPTLPKARSLHTWVVVETVPRPSGCTVRLTHLGWPRSTWDKPESQWPETFAYFEQAWARVFERLKGYAESASR
jgi:uncharacterized protein YndB with AHSA1/START domain/predicted enzyme related to lactoylglutathione lyase